MKTKNAVVLSDGYLDDGQKQTLHNALEVASEKNSHMVNPDIRIQCTLRDAFLYIAEKQAKYMFSNDDKYVERAWRYADILAWIAENTGELKESLA